MNYAGLFRDWKDNSKEIQALYEKNSEIERAFIEPFADVVTRSGKDLSHTRFRVEPYRTKERFDPPGITGDAVRVVFVNNATFDEYDSAVVPVSAYDAGPLDAEHARTNDDRRRTFEDTHVTEEDRAEYERLKENERRIVQEELA